MQASLITRAAASGRNSGTAGVKKLSKFHCADEGDNRAERRLLVVLKEAHADADGGLWRFQMGGCQGLCRWESKPWWETAACGERQQQPATCMSSANSISLFSTDKVTS